jgi:hypothetical protein
MFGISILNRLAASSACDEPSLNAPTPPPSVSAEIITRRAAYMIGEVQNIGNNRYVIDMMAEGNCLSRRLQLPSAPEQSLPRAPRVQRRHGAKSPRLARPAPAPDLPLLQPDGLTSLLIDKERIATALARSAPSLT